MSHQRLWPEKERQEIKMQNKKKAHLMRIRKTTVLETRNQELQYLTIWKRKKRKLRQRMRKKPNRQYYDRDGLHQQMLQWCPQILFHIVEWSRWCRSVKHLQEKIHHVSSWTKNRCNKGIWFLHLAKIAKKTSQKHRNSQENQIWLEYPCQ